MKKILVAVGLIVGLTIVAQPALLAAEAETGSESGTTLRWVGCGISKKAYLTALAKAYEEETGVKIDIQGGGATRGIRDVASLSADIGGSCRRRMLGKGEERGVNMVPVAWDALVVIVHKDNPIEDISLDNLRKVYLGEITNWSELGGANAPIQVYARQGKISGVGRTIRKLVFDNYDQDFAATEIFPSSGPLEKKVVEQPYAISISGISSARKRDVKIIKLEGKYPSYDNVKEGKYLLYRPLYLVYNENNPQAEQIKDFIRFSDSAKGRDVIRSNGTVPYLEGLNLMKQKLRESRTAQREKGLR